MTDIVSPALIRALDENGNPVAAAEMFVFRTGTDTLEPVFADGDATIQHPSPLVANSSGVFAALFSNAAVNLKIDVRDPGTGASLPGYPIDPVPVTALATGGAAQLSFSPTANIPQTNVQSAIETRGDMFRTNNLSDLANVDTALDNLGLSFSTGLLEPGHAVLSWNPTTPAGFIKPVGADLSRTTYSALFARWGENYGAGDGSTTFGTPDARGVAIRIMDDGRGLDTGRTAGTFQDHALQSHDHLTLHTEAVAPWGLGTTATTRFVNTSASVAIAHARTSPVNAANAAAETRMANLSAYLYIKF